MRQQGEIRGKWIHVAPTQCRITREPWRKRKSFTMHLVSEPDRRFPCAPHRRPRESGVQVPDARRLLPWMPAFAGMTEQERGINVSVAH